MIRVTTWNLDGLDDTDLDVRTEAACFELLLREHPPDLVLLQEVVDRALLAHLRPHFAHAGYAWAPPRPVWEGESGCVVLVRSPLKLTDAWLHRFPGSQMGRFVLGARVAWEGRDLLVTTAHLESLPSSRAERLHQARTVLGVLAEHPGPALFAGDTNLRRAETDVLAGIVDAWRLAGAPADRRYTWDATGRARQRFDQVWLDDRSGWRVSDLRLLGRNPPHPSDHLALEVDLTL